MSQTNVQVPIEQRNHDEEVLKKRKVLFGDERFKPSSPPGGPSSLGVDDKKAPLVVYHTSLSQGPRVAEEVDDMLYREHTTNAGDVVAGMPTLGVHKQHMSGRRYAGTQNNAGRNVGSTHLQMPAEPHMAPHVKEPPVEGSVVLPKDQ